MWWIDEIRMPKMKFVEVVGWVEGGLLGVQLGDGLADASSDGSGMSLAMW